MKKEIEIQQENINNLLELIKQNPNLRILPMVETELVGGDDFAWWSGNWGESRLDERWDNEERIHFKSQDFNDLAEDEMDRKDWTRESAEKIVNNYDWEKVIVIKITT